MLNVALLEFTAKQLRESNPELAKKNNVRDFAIINELTVMSNLEVHNVELIKIERIKQGRFGVLLEIAKYQLAVLDEAEKMRDTKNLLKDTEKQ